VKRGGITIKKRRVLEQRTALICDALEDEAGIRLFRREGKR
jgi:hypothetical protein